MNVDYTNFPEVFDFISSNKIIQKSSTISLDLQFTGIRMDNNDKQRYDQFLFQRYQKMRPIAMKYNIIQIGLCFFIQQNDKIQAYPYNFYIFPRSYKNVNPIITLQSGTDNRGMTYMQLSKVMDAMYVPEKVPLDELEKKLTVEQVDEISQVLVELRLFEQSSQDTLELEATSTFIRLIIEKNLEKDFKNMYLQPYNTDSSLKEKLLLSIKKVNASDRKEIDKRLSLDLFGFTKIFQKIWEYKVKVIAHNSLLDLLYIYQSFVGDLPESYFDFKAQINKGFPYFYDTKYLANLPVFSSKFEGTSLQQIQDSILKHPDFFKPVGIQLAKGFEGYDWNQQANQKKLHEAGYDAYLTGWIFYQLSQKIEYQKYSCKLKIVWSMFDMCLNSPDDEWNDEVRDTFTLVLALRRPKQPVPRLFDYRKNLVNYTIDRIKLFPLKTSLKKEDYRYKECRLDYLVIECKSGDVGKRKQFVEAVKDLQGGEVDVMSWAKWIKEKRAGMGVMGIGVKGE